MNLSTIRRPNLREGISLAVAAAGIAAVAASSAVSVADDSVPSRVAMISEAKPAQTAVAAAVAAPAKQAEAEAPVEAPVAEKVAAAAPAPAPTYPDNLDGWIREALDIMRANNIPGSYEGILKNIIRESAGKPDAINLWDSNAAMGIPSKGLLQVIDPTFAAYHVPGTPYDVWDPVANIVAACNYAAHRYGSMDNVNSAY